MFLANITLTISSFVVLMLGAFIIISSPKKAVNRAFFGILISGFLWLIANLLTNLSADPDRALIFARTTLIGATALPYAFLLFCQIFTQDKMFNRKRLVWLGIPPLLILLTVPTPLNIQSTGAYGSDTITGGVYFLLIAVLLLYFGSGLAILVRHYRLSKDQTSRAQLRYVFLGIILTVIPAALTNAILPAILNSRSYLYGPNFIIIFAAFTAVAIIKHRLLDVRLLVARSLTYIMLLAALTGMYGFVVFGVATSVLGSNQFSEKIMPIIAAVFLAFTLQPLSRFFNKMTNRFFYRDAYDTQLFFDQFNKTLVSTYDLNLLLRKSAQIIEDNLRPTYCVFGVRETSNTPQRLIGTDGHPKFSTADIAFVRSQTVKLHQKLIVTELLDEKHADLKKVLVDNDITILARLASSSEEGIGYLALGPKKSGIPYSQQDNKNIEIIANELVIAVQNSLRFEEIENFNQTLQEKVSEATRKLRNTNEKLKALDEAKDDFVSMASHQLRTPLTSIKGYTSMVLEGDAGKINATQRRLLEQSFVSSQRMVYLIADLLNVSRLKTGKFIIETNPVNLAEIVQQEIGQLKETAAGRQLILTFNKPDTFPSLLLDETKTRQVIMNFVDNAIYYTPAGGNIEVKLIETPASVEFRVTDDGIGVPKSEQPHLFTKFYRAGNARKARPDGTGLGLFMAKKVIVAEGGAILFETQEGKGSTFGFVFSKTKLAPNLDEATKIIEVPINKP
ncbi:hypothetical protein BH09PAT3_BH09PAT3_0130 [soil metagenome]